MKKGFWGLVFIFFGGTLPLVAGMAVLPAIGVVERTETYRIVISDVSFPAAGKAMFNFPEGFSLKSLNSVKALVRDEFPDDFIGMGFKVSGQKIEVAFKNRFTTGPRAVLFELRNIRNPQRVGKFEVEIFISNQMGDSVFRSAGSFFTVPDKPIKLVALMPAEVRAGELIQLSASAEDRFGNPVSIASIQWKVSSILGGEESLLGSHFFATRAGSVEIAASNGELTSTPFKLDVVAGGLDHFEITGTPESTVAGVPFPGSSGDSILVTAQDQFGNTIANFSGTAVFSSDDSLAILPMPYTFTVGTGWDNGRHAFPGSRFVLKRAGSRRILVSADGKNGSSTPVRVMANYLADFFFFAPPEVVAGKAFDVAVAGGVDLYGNPASGAVNIIPVLGGGPSPSGAIPAYSSVVVVSGTGKSQQILVSTAATVLRGSNGDFSTFSDTITVLPAAPGGFSLSLLPDTLTAGDTVSTFSVEAKDHFGNRKTDFTGSGYFSSSDSRAILQYSAGHRYSFSMADSGCHTFVGHSVKFLTKGPQSLTFGDDSLRSLAAYFLVLPGLAASFSVSAPSTVVVGVPFLVSVQNAKDGYDNSVSFSVRIGLRTGEGVSPSGDVPVLPVISVTDGSGQGQAVLPRAEKAILEGVSDSLRFSSDTILVSAAGLEKFEWNLGSPQISGAPFSPPAILAAKDRFGNLKNDFNASTDSVIFTAQPPGSWEKGVLKNQGDFVLGAADLSALGVTFFGPGGSYVFSAASVSGKTGNSPPIEVRSVFVDSFSFNPANVIRGQSTSVAFRVANHAPGPFILNDIKLLSAGRVLILALPALPDTLVSSGRGRYAAAASIPADFPMGKFPVELELSGRFDTVFITIRTPVLDSLAVTDSLFLRPSSEGLNFERVSKDRFYSFSIKLINQSIFDVVLDSATRLVFNRPTASRSFNISGTTLLPRNGEGTIAFLPDSFPAIFPSGIYSAALVIFGRRDGVSFFDSLFLGDSVTLEDPAKLYYVPGSLAPRTALLETPLNFRLRLGNNGQAVFQADTLSQLILVHGSDSLFGYLQPAALVGSGSPIELNFWVTQLPRTPPTGIFNWRTSIKLSGLENGLAVDTFLTLLDSVTLYPHPSLILDSLWATTPSPNRVNSDRSFSVRVRLFNPSAETLSATWLYLREGNTQLTSLLVPFLAPQETVERNLTVPADSNRLGPVTYRVEVVPGYGTTSFAPAELMLKMDQISILRQRKAVLAFLLEVVAPPSARGGVLAAGQTLTLTAQLRNLGDAPVSPGRIRLKVTPPALTFISDSSAAVSATQSAVFQLLAQEVVDSGRIVASWAGIPSDSNTAGPAEVAADSVSIFFKILPSRLALLVTPQERPNPLLYAAESTSPFELGFANGAASGSHLFLLKKISIGLGGLPPTADVSDFREAPLSDGVHSAVAVVEAGRLSFAFSPPVLINTGETRNFSLSVRPEIQSPVSLRFYTNADMVEALDSIPNSGATPALLLKASGQPFEYTSSVFTTASGIGLAASLITYPNPFSPPSEKIQMVYRLSAASEVELKIYTLTGERVFEKTYTSGAGTNQIEWDGANGRGEGVKNGVYIAVIHSKTTGETVKQKLAVVK